MMLKTISLAAVALALTALSGPVQARDSANSGQELEVSFADLDISNEAGATVLLVRIEAAARKACGPSPRAGDLHDRKMYNACVDGAVRDAVVSLGNPLVTDLYNKQAASVSIAQPD